LSKNSDTEAGRGEVWYTIHTRSVVRTCSHF